MLHNNKIATKALHCFLCCILVTYSIQTGARDTLVIDKEFKRVNIISYSSYYEDILRTKNIHDILRQDKNQFTPLSQHSNRINFPDNNSAFWIKLIIKNNTALPTRNILQFSFAHMADLQVYQVTANAVEQSKLTGGNHSALERINTSPDYSFLIRLDGFTVKEVYIKATNHQQRRLHAISMLWNEVYYNSESIRHYLIIGICIGIILIYAFVMSVVSLVVPTTINTYFFFYVTNLLIYLVSVYGIGKSYIWTTLPNIHLTITDTTALLQNVFLTMLTQSFFETRKYFTIVHKLLNLSIAFSLLLLAGVFLIDFLNVSINTAKDISFSIIPIYGTLIIGYLAYSAKNVNKYERIGFIVFFSINFLIYLLLVAAYFDVLVDPGSIFIMRLPLFSLETIIFFLVVAYRIFRIQKENSDYKVALSRQQYQQQVREQELQIQTIISTQEVERKRISRDLHDDIGTKLSALKLFISSIADHLNKHLYTQAHVQAAKSEVLIDETMDDIREMLHNLSPAILEEFGVKNAIEVLVNRINEAKSTHFDLVIFGLNFRLSSYYELALYRITQELINNVIKHADAKSAVLQIGYRDEKIMVMIEDNGRGFEVGKQKRGYGFDNLAARITLLNGTMQIDSFPDRGTSVSIEISYNPSENE